MLTILLDPPRTAFTIPFFDFPIYWYSLFFAAGFFAGWVVVYSCVARFFSLHKNFQDKSHAGKFVDTLSWYVFLGTLLGARLGHVLFYDLDYYHDNPLDILNLRQGGLASHGGALGVFIALYVFWLRHARRDTPMSFARLLDYVGVAAALAGACIRIGNFFNQEILGTPSNMPWAVLFGHPAEDVPMPCHPVQLYEAASYLVTFCIVFALIRKYDTQWKAGSFFGLAMLLIFTSRFFIEFFKVPQEANPLPYISMGQLLSLPFIILGCYFLIRKRQ